jgi:hypothetical protein
MRMPRLICLKLFEQIVRFAWFLAALNTGNNNAARIPMTAMTTSSSIRVNPERDPNALAGLDRLEIGMSDVGNCRLPFILQFFV